MPTYPLATLAPTINATGITAPAYNDIYQSLLAIFRNIYGAGVYVAPDSQDGQWIASLASALYDCNQAAVACFNAYRPDYAQGAGLSSIVKINGIQRNTASNSTAQGNVVGQAGTPIINGVVKDDNGNLWNLPAFVIIPIGGLISVTVTAQDAGNIAAPAGTIDSIFTPQYGWQSFVSTIDAVPGAPVESDAALQARQTVSTSLPALGIKEAIYAAVGNVSGVARWTVYENPTASTDSNGLPAHSLAVVALGGSNAAIAAAIASKKPPGAQTVGSSAVVVYDTFGLPTTINYYPLTLVATYFSVTIKALPGYTSATGTSLIASLVAFVNSLAIGEDVYLSQVSAAASLIGIGAGQTFYVTALTLGTAPSPSGTSTIVIAFNAAAMTTTANCALTVT